MTDVLRDPARLAALARSQLMDSAPEEVFDRLTRLASRLLGSRVAVISLVDAERQYFKSSVGIDIDQTPLSHSFCRLVVTDAAPLVVADARRDARLADNPAIEELDVVAYCGVPLTDHDGHTLGAFCAIESEPRDWSSDEVGVLAELAASAMTELRLRATTRALTARERETRAIIDGAHDSFVACDADGRILDWNPAAERLFGWAADEILGRLAAETILVRGPSGDPAPVLAGYAGTSASAAPPIEVSARHRDGHELLVEMTVARVEGDAGPRFNALFRDISVRRATEHHHAQLAQVVESTRDAVTTVDRDGTILSWNEGAELLYGFTAAEMVGRIPDRGTGVHFSQSDQLMPRLLAGEHVTARALPRRHRSGRLIYVDVSAAPLRGDDGEVIGATSIARDVTEQHRLELELEKSEARFRQTFDEAPIGVALVGPNGRWLEVNRALCEIVGYSEEELLKTTSQDITHPDDLDADLDLLGRVLTGEIPTYQLEKRYFHKLGHVIWVKLSVALVRDEAGTPLHCVSHIEDITRAKETESALREGRRLLDESQSVAGVGSWSWNLETGEIAWSVQQFLLHGLNPLDAAPALEEFVAIVHPDDRRRLAASLAAHATVRRPFVDEYRIQLSGSQVRTVSVRGDFLEADPDCGLPPRLAGTTQDVSAERIAAAARQEIENRQRVLLSSLPDTMIALYDRELRCTLLQGPLLEQLGIDPAQFQGRLLSDFMATLQLEALEPHIAGALKGAQTSIEYPTGAGVTCHIDIAPYRSDDGQITGAFTVWRDITDRLVRDRQTRMLANIVEQSDDAIIAKSRDGVITEWNHGAELLYGYTSAEAIGQSIAMLITAERRGEDRRLLASALAGMATPQFETSHVRKDGTVIPVSISVSPLCGADESIVGASIVARDVTDRKRMEDELRASRGQALEASRLKSEFVANMSHEIRTPLNGVVSMAELLLDTRLSAEQAEYAQVALTSAEALMRVINDILDFSKIEAGKLEIVAEDFSVRAAVEEVAEIVGVKANERGLDLRVAVDHRVSDVVRGDSSRMRQVLMNLLSNAVKFTAEGQVSVTVQLEATEGGEPRLRVVVSDTGIGIDPVRLGDLFAPFSQADATTTRRYGGTGLGLCISKQLVELMGGEIGCESSPGEGSRFWFTLPYEPGTSAVDGGVSSDLTGTRVLIVDDVAGDRQVMQTRLAGWGISPDSAGDAAGALALLQRAAEAGRPYETALIDRMMPGMDGLELARAIKAVPSLRATRLILISAEPVDSAVARAAGMEAQLIKPVRQSRLYNQLLATLHQARGVPAPVARPVSPRDGVANQYGRVLLAEDNEVNQFAAIRLLQTFGFSVDVAGNGREAIAMIGRRDYVAVFMDCQMPEVDGYTATEVIRRRERGGPRTPIIALTAHALDGDREKCLAAGMDDYVAKPLRVKAIEELLERLPEIKRIAEPAALGASTIFDPWPLEEFDDPELEAKLANLFLEQAAVDLPAIRKAIEERDAGRVRALAHRLKGGAATAGALRMSELSSDLCELATADLTPRAAEIHAELTQALGLTTAALDRHLRGDRS